MKTVKILSVDDEADLELLLTQYFRRKIRKGEYEFSFAHNGLEALEMLLKNKDYDIILSDINMPEMDGLTLLTKINEMQNPALKCIMVSAYGDMGNIRQAMNNGAFDFATKPIDLDDLSVTIEKAIAQIEYIKRMEQEHQQLEGIKDDLVIASQIQQSILPRIFPPFPDVADKLDISACMYAAKDVGGDFYDFFRIDNDRIGFVMADVSGKGIPAAIFMAVSRTILRPCILKKNGTVEELPQSMNLMVGILDGFEYPEDKCILEPGDTLFTFTDGVTEAMSADFQMYSDARLHRNLSGMAADSCQQIIDTIKADIATHTEGAEQSDDITMLVLKRLQ